MINKKAAAAYVLAQKFLEKGNTKNAAMAFDIGNRLEKIAEYSPEDRVSRRDRQHPAIEFAAHEDDIDGMNKNLDLISQYIKKAHEKVQAIDPESISARDPRTTKKHQDGVRELKELENLQNAFKAVINSKKGRKPFRSNFALEHLKQVIKEDISSGVLGKEESDMLTAYLEYLQPTTGLPSQEYFFKVPPRKLV